MKPGRETSASKLVVVIDDDPLVLEATGGLLRSWGYRVVTAETYRDAVIKLLEGKRRPDLIICDYRLSDGETGIEVIEGVRNTFEIPALLISGDPMCPSHEPASDETASYQLLHKPVDANQFRAALTDACQV